MFRHILQSISVKILVAIINFSILIISSKFLGVSSRGEISIFILNLAIVQGVNDIYTGYSIIHFVPRFNFKKLLLNAALFTIIVCSSANLLINALHKQVQGFELMAFAISLLVIMNTFNSMLLLGKEAIKAFNILAFLQPFLLLIGIFLSVFYFKNYTFQSFVLPLFFSFALSTLASSLVLLKIHKRDARNLVPFELKPILTNGLLYQSAFLLFIFCNRWSFYILTDNKKVGLYAAACMLMESVLLIVNSLTPVLISKIANQESDNHSPKVTLSFVKMAFLSSMLLVCVVWLMPETWILYFLGNGFVGVKTLMLAYAPAILMMSVFSVINQYFSGKGLQKYILWANALGFSMSLFLAPKLISRYDTMGAAYMANISYAVILCASMLYFFKHGKLKPKHFLDFKNDLLFLKNLVKNQGEFN